MNTYEKLNTLIDQAPGVSQWWTSNKRALKWWFRCAMGAGLSVVVVTVLVSFATLIAYSAWLHGQVAMGGKGILMWGPLVSATGIGLMRWADKFWPKRFTHNGFTLKGDVSDETGSLVFTHNILHYAVKIDDPQMKPILARLRTLKDLDLPQCWWKAFANELSNLTPKDPAVNKSIAEKIDAVYVQIEDVAASAPQPKVLRL